MKYNGAAFLVGVSLVISVVLFTNSWDKRISNQNKISVKGLAKRNFTSDLIVWRCSFTRTSFDMKSAYAEIKSDEDVIKAYLISKGIDNKQLVISSINIDQNYDYEYDQNGRSKRVFKGYNLRQEIKIESENVELIEKISREITELIDKGITLYSLQPQYYYTKLADLKLEMIEEATQDATTRADKIATNANSELGKLVNANLGIFQITGQNSNEDYTWGGVYNTSEKNKTASVTMSLQFEID